MKRIACKPKLVHKRRVVTVARPANTPYRGGGSDFYNEIAKRDGRARVCIIRSLGGIGDVLMTTPALRELKRRWPDLHLTYAIDRHRTSNDVYYGLVCNAPFIDAIIDARYVKHSEYDAVCDISAVCIRYERSDLPPINRIDLFARKLGVSRLRNPVPFYHVETDEARWAAVELARIRPAGHKVVALHTASFEDKRSWPIENILGLTKLAQTNDLPVVFVVFDFNRKYLDWDVHNNTFDYSNTNLRQMAALISQCDLFIGPDSGPMHLAGALNKPSLVTFGSIPPQARINHYRQHKAIQLSSLNCLGCWYSACPYNIRCMNELSSQLVYNEMVDKLEV